VSWLDASVPGGSIAHEHLDLDAFRAWAATMPSLPAALAAVTRADWLLFLALLETDEQKLTTLVSHTCACVRELLPHGPADPRVEAALIAAERWSRGETDRGEPRTAAAHAQAAAVGRSRTEQVVCHAAAACARAVLALERPPAWKAAIADQALRASVLLLADLAVAGPADESVAAYEARREAVAAARVVVHQRFLARFTSR
jgi:hypothetical protein